MEAGVRLDGAPIAPGTHDSSVFVERRKTIQRFNRRFLVRALSNLLFRFEFAMTIRSSFEKRFSENETRLYVRNVR